MRIISFKEMKNLPGRVTVMWIVALLLAVAGMALILLDMFEVMHDTLTIALTCIVSSMLITLFGLRGYKDRLYKKVGDKSSEE